MWKHGISVLPKKLFRREEITVDARCWECDRTEAELKDGMAPEAVAAGLGRLMPVAAARPAARDDAPDDALLCVVCVAWYASAYFGWDDEERVE